MLLFSLAWATSVSALVEVGPAGLSLRDAVLIPEDTPSEPGRLRVLSAEGEVLASAALDEELHRSVIFAEGGGAGAALQHGVVRVRVPWPEGASTLALGPTAISPRTAPPTEAVQLSGPPELRLDIVFLGDGYTSEQLGLYADDVDRMVGNLLSIPPYAAYTGLFNIWRIDRASQDSGVSHYEGDQQVVRDTAYRCYYGCGGVDRLVCCDDALVLGAVNDDVPHAEGVIVLVNDPIYGGSGGSQYATSYTDGHVGEQVATHEIGHSLVGLWDEYSYEYPANVGDGPNCASTPGSTPWEHWLDDPQVDAFQVCSYTNYYRPTDTTCMMNTLQDAYCPVCRERAVLAIYDRLPSLLESSPEEETITLPADLAVQTLGPDDGSEEILWLIDGVEVAEGHQVGIPCVPGEELTVQVRDPTTWVRSDPEGLLQDRRTWELLPCEPGPDDTSDSGIVSSSERPGLSPACGCGMGPSWAWFGLWPLLLLAGRRKRV